MVVAAAAAAEVQLDAMCTLAAFRAWSAVELGQSAEVAVSKLLMAESLVFSVSSAGSRYQSGLQRKDGE